MIRLRSVYRLFNGSVEEDIITDRLVEILNCGEYRVILANEFDALHACLLICQF